MRRQLALFIIAAVGVLGSGCYGTRIAAVETRTARIEDRLTAVEKSQRDLTTSVQQLDQSVREQTELVREGRATSDERQRELERALQILAQRVDESGELYRELKDTVHYRAVPGDSTAAAAGAGGGSPRAIYDAAYQDLTRGNHGLAILGFQEVIAKYGASELADNAQYWIGESYYAQKEFKQALAEFQKTVSTYPQGDKVPAALLKSGLCLQQLGDQPAARSTYESLVSRYPESEEARLARTKIQEM